MDGQRLKKANEQENRAKGARDKDQETALKSGEPTVSESFRRFSGFGSKPGDILALQRTVGNQAVQRLLAERGAARETRPDISRQESAGDQGTNHNHPELITADKSINDDIHFFHAAGQGLSDVHGIHLANYKNLKGRVSNLEAHVDMS